MIDREKVLQALEHCDLCSDMPDCPGCAYLREPNCGEHLKRDVLVLLKTQEPVKPIEIWYGNMLMYYQCPACTSMLRAVDKYCSQCGRAVKWE